MLESPRWPRSAERSATFLFRFRVHISPCTGIWMTWIKELVLTSEGADTPVRLEFKGFRHLWIALYFKPAA